MKKSDLQIMAILNATPDSFFDNGRHFSLEKGLLRAEEIIREGADIIDIGGESTRPGAIPVSIEEELDRVLPLFKGLKGINIPLSIDTRHAEVAKKAVEAGAVFINDVEGFRCPKMRAVAADCDARLCVMHMQNTPETMQKKPSYPEGILPHLLDFFKSRIDTLLSLGIREERIILDPGIGFGKTVEHNLTILKTLPEMKKLGFPVLIGASRKSFLGKILDLTAKDLLIPTLAAHFFAFHQGADIVRVHDVKEHVYIKKIMKELHSG